MMCLFLAVVLNSCTGRSR